MQMYAASVRRCERAACKRWNEIKSRNKRLVRGAGAGGKTARGSWEREGVKKRKKKREKTVQTVSVAALRPQNWKIRRVSSCLTSLSPETQKLSLLWVHGALSSSLSCHFSRRAPPVFSFSPPLPRSSLSLSLSPLSSTRPQTRLWNLNQRRLFFRWPRCLPVLSLPRQARAKYLPPRERRFVATRWIVHKYWSNPEAPALAGAERWLNSVTN